jgi:hypothetical protein
MGVQHSFARRSDIWSDSQKTVEAMGGEFKEIIIGGAAMNPEVEEFFHRIHFPFHHRLWYDRVRTAHQLRTME